MIKTSQTVHKSYTSRDKKSTSQNTESISATDYLKLSIVKPFSLPREP